MTPEAAELQRRLDADGFAIVRSVVARRTVERLAADLAQAIEATPFSEGLFYGSRTKRFGRLLARSTAAIDMATNPTILAAARTAIASTYPKMGLNLTQLIAVHPGARPQVPHRDDEMWPAGTMSGEHMVNVIWPLTRFTAENGATLVWARSHRDAKSPADAAPTVAEMEPGDALVVLGSTLHAQGEHHSDDVRTGVVIGYRAAWLLPGENPWLSYPPEIAGRWSQDLQELVGYARVPPNLNGVDCRCPSSLLAAEPGATGAVDQLWAAQEEGLRRFHGIAA